MNVAGTGSVMRFWGLRGNWLNDAEGEMKVNAKVQMRCFGWKWHILAQ